MKNFKWVAIFLVVLAHGCMPQPKHTRPRVPDTWPTRNDSTSFSLPAHWPTIAQLEESLELLAKDPGDGYLMRNAGTLYQMLSPPDHWDYVDSALDLLSRAVVELPKDPQTLMYLGLAKAIHARDPKVPLFSKLSWAKSGFALMDEAVTQDPDNVSLHLLRAKAELVAPPIVGRRGQLLENRLWLLARIERADVLGDKSLPDYLKAATLVFFGDFAHRIEADGETARGYWQRAAELGGDTMFGDQARQRFGPANSGF